MSVIIGSTLLIVIVKITFVIFILIVVIFIVIVPVNLIVAKFNLSFILIVIAIDYFIYCPIICPPISTSTILI